MAIGDALDLVPGVIRELLRALPAPTPEQHKLAESPVARLQKLLTVAVEKVMISALGHIKQGRSLLTFLEYELDVIRGLLEFTVKPDVGDKILPLQQIWKTMVDEGWHDLVAEHWYTVTTELAPIVRRLLDMLKCDKKLARSPAVFNNALSIAATFGFDDKLREFVERKLTAAHKTAPRAAGFKSQWEHRTAQLSEIASLHFVPSQHKYFGNPMALAFSNLQPTTLCFLISLCSTREQLNSMLRKPGDSNDDDANETPFDRILSIQVPTGPAIAPAAYAVASIAAAVTDMTEDECLRWIRNAKPFVPDLAIAASQESVSFAPFDAVEQVQQFGQLRVSAFPFPIHSSTKIAAICRKLGQWPEQAELVRRELAAAKQRHTNAACYLASQNRLNRQLWDLRVREPLDLEHGGSECTAIDVAIASHNRAFVCAAAVKQQVCLLARKCI